MTPVSDTAPAFIKMGVELYTTKNKQSRFDMDRTTPNENRNAAGEGEGVVWASVRRNANPSGIDPRRTHRAVVHDKVD